MNQTIEEVKSEIPRSSTDGSLRPVVDGRARCLRRARRFAGASICAVSAAMPGRVWAQAIDDTPPSNVGLPGGALIAQIIGWGKWVGLAVCVLAIVYGAATWRGMGGNSGRGVEGKAYVGAGMLGAMLIGLAVIAVNTLYGAGQAGG